MAPGKASKGALRLLHRYFCNLCLRGCCCHWLRLRRNDRLHCLFVAALMLDLGMDAGIVAAWVSFYASLSRIWKLGKVYSLWWRASCGLGQG